jgi:hypothetical protein
MLIMGYKKKCEEMGILDDVMNRINELNIWIFSCNMDREGGEGKTSCSRKVYRLDENCIQCACSFNTT